MTQENNRIIRKTVPVVKDTLLSIKVGETLMFDCREFAPYSTIQSSISRLNKHLGKVAFTSKSTDNGATYTITRHS